MQTNYKIVFFDIDGTLVDSHAPGVTMMDKIPQSTKDAIQQLEANGIITAIATGRGKAIIQPLLADLGMTSYISSNGQSLVFHGEEIHKQFIEKEKIKALIDQLEDQPVIIGFETEQGRIVADAQLADFHPRFKDYPQINGTIDDYLTHDIYQVAIYTNDFEAVKIKVPGISARVVGPLTMNAIPASVSNVGSFTD